MPSNRTTLKAIVAPETVEELLVRPAFAESVAGLVSNLITIGTSELRLPVVAADPSAAWTAEGAEITPSDITTDEIHVVPSKIAGLSIITSELAEDSSPEAAEVVGDGLARDIARKIDAAFFGNLASPAPKGLESLTTSTVKIIANSGAPTWTDIDPFNEAQYVAEGVGASLTSWVANPTDALALAKLRQGQGSNVPLLQPDPTQPSRRQISGLPLYISSAVTAGTIWGIPKSRCHVVVRTGSTVDVDPSAYFSSDRVAVRAKMRVGFGFNHSAAIVKISRAA